MGWWSGGALQVLAEVVLLELFKLGFEHGLGRGDDERALGTGGGEIGEREALLVAVDPLSVGGLKRDLGVLADGRAVREVLGVVQDEGLPGVGLGAVGVERAVGLRRPELLVAGLRGRRGWVQTRGLEADTAAVRARACVRVRW